MKINRAPPTLHAPEDWWDKSNVTWFLRGQNSLRASSPGSSGRRAGKGRRICNYVSGIWISACRCELLIGWADISNDVITLGACPHLYFNVCLHSRSFPLRVDWWKSDSSVDGEPQRNWRRIKRRSCKLSFLFPPCCQSARACASKIK